MEAIGLAHSSGEVINRQVALPLFPLDWKQEPHTL